LCISDATGGEIQAEMTSFTQGSSRGMTGFDLSKSAVSDLSIACLCRNTREQAGFVFETEPSIDGNRYLSYVTDCFGVGVINARIGTFPDGLETGIFNLMIAGTIVTGGLRH
jgi:hypothetical protein